MNIWLTLTLTLTLYKGPQKFRQTLSEVIMPSSHALNFTSIDIYTVSMSYYAVLSVFCSAARCDEHWIYPNFFLQRKLTDRSSLKLRRLLKQKWVTYPWPMWPNLNIDPRPIDQSPALSDTIEIHDRRIEIEPYDDTRWNYYSVYTV